MSLATEAARLQAVDLKGMKGMSSDADKAVSGVNRGLDRLCEVDSSTADLIDKSLGALQVIAGSMGLMRSLQVMWEARNTAKEAESAALTAARVALGPIGFIEIAIAATAASAASLAMYALVNDIEVGEFDLSTSAGVNGMLDSLGAIL